MLETIELTANASWVKRPGSMRSNHLASVWIDGHKFETPIAYCKIEGQATAYKEAYLLERWYWFNQHCFSAKMKEPQTFLISRNSADIKTLGSWNKFYRRMTFHPKMFDLKDEGVILGTIAHEMAHQFVSDILKTTEEDSHGPTWQQVMADLGLPVESKYTGGRDTLLDSRQRKAFQEHKDAGGGEAKASDYAGSVVNYAWYFNIKSVKREPVLVIGNGVLKDQRLGLSGVYLPTFSVKEITGGSPSYSPVFSWTKIDFLTKVSRLGALTFPEELRSKDAIARADTVFTHLMRNSKIAEVSDLIMEEYRQKSEGK